MGLDMNLYAERGRSYNNEDYQEDFAVDFRDMKPQSVKYEMAYWRKHHRLHGFIVRNFATDGDDNCDAVYIDADDCKKIIDAIRAHTDEEPGDMPPTLGFFFGNGDEGYDTDTKLEDIAIFHKAIEFMNDKDDGYYKSLVYQASW